MEKQITSPSVKGLVISVALIAFSVVVAILQQDANRMLSIIPVALMLGGIIWACMSYSKQMDGNVTFGHIFSHGFKTAALVAAVMGLWLVLYLLVLFPDALDRGMEAQRAAMEKQGGVSEEQMDKYMTMGRKMAVPMGTIVSVIMNLIIGAIGALIGAAIAKKNPNQDVNANFTDINKL